MGLSKWVGQRVFGPYLHQYGPYECDSRCIGCLRGWSQRMGPLEGRIRTLEIRPWWLEDCKSTMGQCGGANWATGCPHQRPTPEKAAPSQPLGGSRGLGNTSLAGRAAGHGGKIRQGGTTMAAPWGTFGEPYLHEYRANFDHSNCQALLTTCTRRRRGHRGCRTRIPTVATAFFPPALLHHGGPAQEAVPRPILVRF